jgi:Na+/H+-dicarboxylate symporter
VVAVVLGVAVTLALRPGVGMTERSAAPQTTAAMPSITQVLLDFVPVNAVRAFSEGNIAQIVVLSVFLGIATLLLNEGPRDRLRALFADAALLLRKLVEMILIVAPIGIGALMAVTVGRYGAALFGPVARFVAGSYIAFVVMVVLYLLLLRLFTTERPLAFLKQTGTLWATTSATTSSLASLPVALESAEKLRLPRSVYTFTLPLGIQINKDGTAILLAAIVVFTAQAAGVALTAADLLTTMLLSMMLAAGSGGIPSGGFVIALIIVEAMHLPLELAAIIGGIYRLVDMGGTTVNVMGNMVGTILVSHSEGSAA